MGCFSDGKDFGSDAARLAGRTLYPDSESDSLLNTLHISAVTFPPELCV